MTITEYRMVSLTAAKHMREDGAPCSAERRCAQCFPKSSGIKASIMGSALVVPPPPDYSTPKAVTARCIEGGTRCNADILAASRDTGFRGAYREFRKAVPERQPCRVEDTHASKWIVVPEYDDPKARWPRVIGWTLAPKPEPQPEPVPVPAPKAARRRRVA